jgi:DNA-binding transcriptional regulator LsrR (DeoR family)
VPEPIPAAPAEEKDDDEEDEEEAEHSEEEAGEVQRLNAAGASQRQIAEQLGIPRTRVRRYLARAS